MVRDVVTAFYKPSDDLQTRSRIDTVVSDAFSSELFSSQLRLLSQQVKNDFSMMQARSGRSSLTQLVKQIDGVMRDVNISPGPANDRSPSISPSTAIERALKGVKLVRGTAAISTLFNQFLQRQAVTIEDIRVRQKTLHAAMLNGALAALSGSLLLAAILVAVYSRYISVRLSRLVMDAEQISKRGTEIVALSGRDEIAHVQDILIGVNRRLETMEQHRQFVLEMVAHDVRTPLTSAQMALGLAKTVDE